MQRQIADLLQRIALPDYLFALVRGRSYVDNATAHIGGKSVRQLDIDDFFPNCTANKVVWSFLKRTQSSIDVAAIIKGIVTRNGSQPQAVAATQYLRF